MQLLSFAQSGKADERHAILLFGSGLIGEAILGALPTSGLIARHSLAFDWKNQTVRQSQANTIVAATLKLLAGIHSRISIVWAAGQAGFAADNVVLDAEWLSFQDILSLAEKLRDACPRAALSFHLVSSAGGLFEGQTFVDDLTSPLPLRPYGFAKLKQETAVTNLEGFKPFIYRPSTVYGYKAGGRVGLITMLISNAQRFAVTRIFGRPQTLRDFVHADDVGRYIAEQVCDGAARPHTGVLGSAKPTSASEVIGLVRSLIRRPVYLQYDPTPTNALNNSYLEAAIPAGFNAISLATGIRRTILAMERSEFSGR